MRRPRSKAAPSGKTAPGRASSFEAKGVRPAADGGAGKGRSAPKRTPRRRRLPTSAALAILLGLLVIAYGGYWVFLGAMLKQGLADTVTRQRDQGIEISHGPASLGGFPLRVTARLTDVSVRAAPAQGGWSWSSPALSLAVRPWQPTVLHADLSEAPHRLTLPNAPPPGSFRLEAEQADLSVRLDGRGRVLGAGAQIGGAVATPVGPNGAPVAGPGGALERLSLDYHHKPLLDPGSRDVTRTLSARVRAVSLSGTEELPLGPRLESAALDAVLLGGVARDRRLEDALRAWRDGDGRLRIDRLSLVWAPLSVEAAGALGLDAALQPEGTVNTRIWGFSSAIDALAERGLVRGRDATMAKVLLGGLSRRTEDGRQRLEIPVIVRDGHVWAGPVALMPLPRLPWGPPPGSLGAHGLKPGFSVDPEGNVIPDD